MTVVGGRPQFIKAAPLARALAAAGHEELLIHTGQHYDEAMSAAFFAELRMDEPTVNLEVGELPGPQRVRAMLDGLSAVIETSKPDAVVVLGDTDSTLAGALAASLFDKPLAHVEAGLRSFDRRMPEERNRVITDHCAQLLLCPSDTARDNLAAEGITEGVQVVGDVMRDALEDALAMADPQVLSAFGVDSGSFVLATIHRASNTDDPSRLQAILDGLGGADEPVVFPVHPRTAKVIKAAALRVPPNVHTVEPVGCGTLVRLAEAARVVLTDSGGLQKEAYWLGTPCVTARDATEWVETVDVGWNVLAGADADRISSALRAAGPGPTRPELYGETGASSRCVAALEQIGA